MIKPDCYRNIGKIINAIENTGFVISNIKMAKMELSDAQQFYAEHKVRDYLTTRENHSTKNLQTLCPLIWS